MKRLLILVLTVTLVTSEEDALKEFIGGNLQFTADVYKENLKTVVGNTLISPFSAETILALALEGAKGDTADEFIKRLNFPSTKEKTTLALKQILPQFTSADPSLELLSANKLYINDGFTVNEDYKKIAKDTYLADAENINFGDSFTAAGTINNWVENRTNDKIKELVDPKSLTADVKVVLVNTLYFKGNWVNPFDTFDTRKEKFYTSAEKSVEVPTMHTTDYFNYYENKELKAKFIELPYDGGLVTMTVVLPDKKTGLESLEAKVEEVLKPQPYTSERVYVALPRFTIESQVKFVPILKNLGLTRAFVAGDADFSGIGGKQGDLYISDVFQKTFINVTETGTEAASSTAAIIDIRVGSESMPASFNFTADHPFIYYLSFKNIILFVGKLGEI